MKRSTIMDFLRYRTGKGPQFWTNAVSERSFSAMKRVKTYLRSTMTDNRLNHTMTLHIHKEETDTLDLVSIANEFCEMTETETF